MVVKTDCARARVQVAGRCGLPMRATSEAAEKKDPRTASCFSLGRSKENAGQRENAQRVNNEERGDENEKITSSKDANETGKQTRPRHVDHDHARWINIQESEVNAAVIFLLRRHLEK